MERYNNNHDESKPGKRSAGIFISKQTLDTILRQKTRRADMIALLNFYHYTALWQGTNQPRASLEYVARGLQWGRDKARAARSSLLTLRLIEDIRRTDGHTGKAIGWYIRLPYFHPTENQGGGTTLLKTPPVVKSDTNALRSVRRNALRYVKHTQSAVFSANGLTEDQKQVVSCYNKIFVPLGWLSVNKITPAVRNVLENCSGEEFHALADTVATNRANWPRKHTFTELFWKASNAANGAKPRLAALKSKKLQSLRSKLIAERNSGMLTRAEMDTKREQLLQIKQILEGRGIKYAASL